MNLNQLLKAINETLYMTLGSLLFSVLIGILIGIVLFITKSDGLCHNKFINRITDIIVNILRAVPFIILMFILMPLSKILTGTILGATAALPSLVFAAAPFYARLAIIAFDEVDKKIIESALAMGANKRQIIFKVVLSEAMPSLVSGIGVTAISLVSYTAMAGAIGSGGLGNLAYMYGLARYNPFILYSTTIIIVIIVFIIQFITDSIVKKIDKK